MRECERTGEGDVPLQSVYVARTVFTPQRNLLRFRDRVSRQLRGRAHIHSLGKLHLTFLESKGVKPYFYARGYTPDRVEGFKSELEDYLSEECPVEDKKVRVDPRQPLVFITGRQLALNIEPTDRLTMVRDCVEQFLVKQFGELPEMVSFNPHVTLGRFYAGAYISSRERSYPEALFPQTLYPPDFVALNGLSVYLGRIQGEANGAAVA